MTNPKIITGLDIGSSKVAAVSAQIEKDGILKIIAQASEASKGISRGLIVDLDEATDSVARVLEKLRDKMSKKPAGIYVNISGADIKGQVSRGMIPLALRGREITKFDISRCVSAASTIRLPLEREIIHRVVHNFSVDDQPWIKNPLGLFASRLSCEVFIITVGINHIQNLYKCINSAGYDVTDIVFTGIADGSALLTKQEREEGVLLLDIGNAVTEASIFFEGALRELSILPIGAGEIKDGFRESAELANLLSQITSFINNFLKTGGRISYITMIGGMTFTDGIAEYIEEKLSYPVKMGVVKDVRGDISGLDSVRLATAIGLAKYASEIQAQTTLTYKNMHQFISAKIIDLFNNYF